MQKTYELNDNSIKNKRLYNDFNLYSANLNISLKDDTDDLKKYGRTQ